MPYAKLKIQAPVQVSLAHAIQRTYEIRQAIKELEAEAKALRPVLDDAVSTHNLVTMSGFALIKTDRTRTELDKDAVRSALGDRYDACTKEIKYSVLDIKLVHQ
jgi:hypothetical protein